MPSSWWRKNDPRSEYEGRGVLPSTLFPIGEEDMTAGDKLRLQSLTGQEVDAKAPLDPYFWLGNVAPDKDAKAPTEIEVLNAADPY